MTADTARPRRRFAAGLGRSKHLIGWTAIAAMVVAAFGTSPAVGDDRVALTASDDATVVADWNATGVATIVTDAAKGPAEAYIFRVYTTRRVQGR